MVSTVPISTVISTTCPTPPLGTKRITTPVTGTYGLVTVTVAVPDTAGLATDVAVTIRVAFVSTCDTVSTPLALIVDGTASPAWFVTVQVTAWDGLFVPCTVAVNVCVWPRVRDTVAGDTVTPVTTAAGTYGLVTVTVAVPENAGLATDVAITIRVAFVSVCATVSTPLALMVDGTASPAWFVTVHVTAWDGLFVPCTVAVNVCVWPRVRDTVAGATVTPVTTAAGIYGLVTVTVAVPDTAVLATDVALTTSCDNVSFCAMVSTPLAFIVDCTGSPDWFVTVHVTACDGLPVPLTVAVKVWLPPRASDAVPGVTVTLVAVGATTPQLI